MKEFFAGRDAELLTKESEISGIRVWSMELGENDLGHMSCRMGNAGTFIYILRGNLICQINRGKEELSENEGIFINRNNAYRFKDCGREGCRLILVEVEAAYLNVDSLTEAKYVNPVIKNEGLFSLKFTGENAEQQFMAESICAMAYALEKKNMGYELDVRSFVLSIWGNLCREAARLSANPKKSELREKEKLCRMLEYLHIHYNEKITLTEMAENSQVSTGEYCRFFKKRMEQTPFEYLQTCRIERSIPEVLEKSESITKIAMKHGFTGSSYYAETFKKEMGCTPGEYRKWYFEEPDTAGPVKETKAEPPKKAVRAERLAKAPKAVKVPAEKPVSTRRSSMPAHLL